MYKLLIVSPDREKIRGCKVNFMKPIEVGNTMMFSGLRKGSNKNFVHRSAIVERFIEQDNSINVVTKDGTLYIFREVSNEEN